MSKAQMVAVMFLLTFIQFYVGEARSGTGIKKTIRSKRRLSYQPARAI
jgi:hypothetical protein